jgi:hypothetical protein
MEDQKAVESAVEAKSEDSRRKVHWFEQLPNRKSSLRPNFNRIITIKGPKTSTKLN